MKLGDIYVNKENRSVIQINSYASPMGKFSRGGMVVVFRQIEKHNESGTGSCPSFNGYGTQEEIEQEYRLLIPEEKLSQYRNWDDIFKLAGQNNPYF